jgi:cytochrome c oxidase accessory protein FixG
MSDHQESLLKPEGRVLSTLEADGSRRWLHPRLSLGRYWHARRIVAYALVLIFNVLPWVRINGHPALLFDIADREFHIFGLSLLPTDNILMALFMITALLGVFFFTAVMGRIWCGWGCPQTVYMEYLFRPIERFFKGRSGVGGKPTKPVAGWRTIAMYATFLVICFYLSNVFLAYFVGTDRLVKWVLGNPFEHFAGFALVVVVTGLMMFDFAYWREQLCIIGCPYGRFQSVLLDKHSLIVSYDPKRGEPRSKGKRVATHPLPVLSQRTAERATDNPPLATSAGDCIDCTMCVQVCPTGIDIRNGLQLECINCTQCIDACDAVMDKINRPRGLIRYASQASLAGAKWKLLRPRVVLYGTILTLLCTLMGVLIATRPVVDLVVFRGRGNPYTNHADGLIENTFLANVTNRTDQPQTYAISVTTPGVRLVRTNETFQVQPGQVVVEPIHVFVPGSMLNNGRLDIEVKIESADGKGARTRYARVLGPRDWKPTENKP